MKAAAARVWSWLWAALRWRLRVPLTRLRVALGVVLGLLLALSLGTGIAMHQTGRPLFCMSCHEMGVHVETWRVSSHRQVECSKCHIMPGTLNMFRSKVGALRQVYLHMRGEVETSAIRAHVPDANCKLCHPRTRDLIVYHNLQITHQAHWQRGIECTFCHDRVVHGPQAATKNTPRMETCYKCHDGQRAPNTCSTCHVVLGERRPSTFSAEWVAAHRENIRSEGRRTCVRCHQEDFCDNCHRAASPHPGDWLAQHPQGFRQRPRSCRLCHALPSEAGEMSFCRECHALRRAHGLNWLRVHYSEFRRDPRACARCHEQNFCSDCHALYRHHPQDWQRTHPAAARARPQGCQECHTADYCARCHQKAVPKSHTAQWPRRHGAAADAGCALCHKPDFCQACHRSAAGRPQSHGADWRRSHAAAWRRPGAACQTCHQSDFCNTCHGLAMPHAEDWLAAHRAAARRDDKVCARCHDRSFCDACHRGTQPASHRNGWLERHGAQAKANRAECLACHRESLCAACHRGLAMPHPRDWPIAHGAAAKEAPQRQKCAACHAQTYCASCHRVEMPHPQEWLERHGAAAIKASADCLRCHGPQSAGRAAKQSPCAACHEALAPPDHEPASWVPEQHYVAGSDDPDLCALCHGANSCDSCHAQRGVGRANTQ